MIGTADFALAPRGFATSFAEQDLPQEYCLDFANIYTNATGDGELREGMVALVSALPENITITGFHEIVNQDGSSVLLATGAGQIWKVNEAGGAHTKVFTFEHTGEKVFSFYAARRLIFYNGVDRNVYTQDGVTFNEMLSILETGTKHDSTSDNATSLSATVITNWLGTDVSEMDLVYYSNSSAFGLITTVASALLTHTPVSGVAGGIGAGSLAGGATPVSGDPFAIIDTVEANIVPVSGLAATKDNEVNIGAPSSTLEIYVTAVPDFTETEIRPGDYVYNETRNQVGAIATVSAQRLTLTRAVVSQTAGDRVRFLKSSQPICKWGVAHFQRAYMIDARDDQKVRISAPGDPENMGSLDSGTYDISTQQPSSERFRSLLSFQRFLIVGGTRHIYAFQGTDPIGVIDRSTGAYILNPDWSDLGLFPAGLISRTGMANIGNDILWATNNGIRSATLAKTTAQLTEDSASNQLDKTLRRLFKLLPEDEIVAIHYPRRSWLMFRAGDELYIYNYSSSGQGEHKAFIGGQEVNTKVPPAWHLFTGRLAQMKIFFVRESGDIVCGGVNGQINSFDTGHFGDLGESVEFRYESAWHSFEKGQKGVARKHGKFIRPIFEAPDGVAMEVSVVAPYSRDSTDSVSVSAASGLTSIGSAEIGEWTIGGSDVSFEKVPMRWNGETAKFRLNGRTASGPFILSGYTVYYNEFGAR